MESESPEGQPGLARITRGEWALVLVLVAIHFTHMVDFVIIMPLGERLMRELSITPAQFSWIIAVYPLAACIASLAASFVMDRFDRRSVLLAMYGGFVLSTLFCGLAPNYEILLVSRTLAGVFGGLAAVTIMAVIGDVFPPEKRGRAAGAITSAFAVASIAGLPLGLVLAEWWGRGAPFVALAALSAGVWVVGWARVPPVCGHLAHPRHHPLTEFAAVVKEGGHQWAFVFSFFLVLGTFTVGSFTAPYLSATNGWGEAQLALLYSVAGVCTLLGMNVVGRLADRLPRLRLFRLLAGLATVSALLLTNLPPGPLWVAAVVLSAFMVFSAGRIVPSQAMLLGTALPRNRGAFMSLNTAVQHLASGIAPVMAGLLITQTADGKLTGFPMVGLVAAAATVVSLLLAGRLRPAAVPVAALGPPAEKEAATGSAVVECLHKPAARARA
jgi:predicted MFS family arabinose efflux permease